MRHDLLEGLRTTEKVALELFASDIPQETEHLLRFHALHQRMDTHVLGHVDDGGQHLPGLCVHAAHKAHVHLQLIEGVILEHVQRGKPAAEVIHPDLVACFAEPIQCGVDPLRHVREQALGDLNMEVVSGDAVFRSAAIHLVEDVTQLKIQPGEVNGNGDNTFAPIHDLAQAGANLSDDTAIQPVDQPVILQQADELLRLDQTSFRVNPAGQRLKSAHLTCDRSDHWLVVYLYEVPFQSVFKRIQQ